MTKCVICELDVDDTENTVYPAHDDCFKERELRKSKSECIHCGDPLAEGPATGDHHSSCNSGDDMGYPRH